VRKSLTLVHFRNARKDAGRRRTCWPRAAITVAVSLLGTLTSTFHQGCDVTILGAADEVVLPMTRNGAVLDFRGGCWQSL